MIFSLEFQATLHGKVVWITGASSGIGKYLALELAKHGVKLCISARRELELEKVKEECLVQSSSLLKPNDILVLKMDMLEIDKHKEHFEKVLTHFDGQLDILVNNAGRSQRAKWEEIDVQIDRDLFELDVFSILNLSRIFVRHIEKYSRKGHLAVVSSLAGVIIAPNSASYVGAKFAINVSLNVMDSCVSISFKCKCISQAYFEALKAEKPHIDVTIINPGPVFSSILEHAFTGNPNEVHNRKMNPAEHRLTAERCGILIGIALANRLHICTCALFPWTFLGYIWKCYPNLRYL